MQKEQQQLEQAHGSYDDAEPWHLPIGHRVEDSLDTEGIAMASTDTAIPENNKGFQMLQKMGWKGTGLGRNEDGELLLLLLPFACTAADVVGVVRVLEQQAQSSGQHLCACCSTLFLTGMCDWNWLVSN